MSLIPEFWTQIVVVIDSRVAIPSSAIPSQLLWSRDLALDVTITRKDFDHPVDSQHERAQVISVMSTLRNPPTHRIRMMFFDLMFSSSLPPFPEAFYCTARSLEDLHLECRKDTGRSADDWKSVTSTEQQLEFRALHNLVIDGRNYFNARKGDLHLAAKFMEVERLTISHYQPLPGESFLTSDFLRPIVMLKRLQLLKLTDLTLDPSPLPLPTPAAPFVSTQIVLKDIDDSRFLPGFFSVFETSTAVTVTHSKIGGAGSFFSESLTIEDIDADQDIVPLLRSWEGIYLTVKACPSFDDTVLHMMACRAHGTPDCASEMEGLTIVDCPNFSVTELKKLVVTRSSPIDGPAIHSLRVYGHGPVISAEDGQWLSDNITRFNYQPTYHLTPTTIFQ